MRGVVIAALGISMVLHLGGLHAFDRPKEVTIEGGAPAPAARLGNGFTDITMGATPSTAPTPATEAVQTVQTASATSTVIAPRSPTVPTATPTAPSQLATSAAPSQTVTGTAPVVVQTPTPQTSRPRTRSDRQPEQRQPQRTQPPGQNREERRGQTDGQQQARTPQGADRNRPATTQGNAAASNYPGVVMRKISRTRRPRVGQRGSAIVGFTVSANGGIASARILRSSGNTQIDRAALQHINRAAPFPPPPQGATRRFQVQYDSR